MELHKTNSYVQMCDYTHCLKKKKGLSLPYSETKIIIKKSELYNLVGGLNIVPLKEGNFFFLLRPYVSTL